ncbi:hypothetical protein ACOME3_008166 [Neoechinorhynchus agilis]
MALSGQRERRSTSSEGYQPEGFNCADYFLQQTSTSGLSEDKHIQPSFAAAQTLIECVKQSHPGTMFELLDILGRGQRQIEAVADPCSLPAVRAGCRAFRAYAGYVRTAQLEYKSFKCPPAVHESGRKFVEAAENSKNDIARFAIQNALIACAGVSSDRPILVHSHSSVVHHVLKIVAQKRAQMNQKTHVLVTKSDADLGGFWMYRKLADVKSIDGEKDLIHVEIINDSSVGLTFRVFLDLDYGSSFLALMETVSLVLLGAEAVTQDGGIVNRSGTLSICICAKHFKVPVVVLAEMFKWSDYCPRNNHSMAAEFKYGSALTSDHIKCNQCNGCTAAPSQVIDYTEGKLISLHICEDGPMDPNAVSLEIINTFVR